MSIRFTKLKYLMDSRGISAYKMVKKDKIIGGATWDKIQRNDHVDTRTINALCKYLKCQPGDIMEYEDD